MIAFLVPLLIGLAAAMMTSRVYLAQGQLIVLEPSDAGSASASGLSAFSSRAQAPPMESEMEILGSRGVLSDAIEQIGADQFYPASRIDQFIGRISDNLRARFSSSPDQTTPAGPDFDEVLDRLTSEVRISNPQDSNIILVSFSHPDRQLAAEVVDAIMQAYLSRRQPIVSESRYAFIAAEVDRYSQTLADIEDQIQEIEAENNVLDLSRQIVLAVNQVDEVEQRIREATARREALSGELTTTRNRLEEIPERIFDFSESTDRGPNEDARARLIALQVERSTLSDRYNERFPRLQEIDREIETIRSSMASGQSVERAEREVRNPNLGFLENRLLTLQIDRESIDSQLDELERQRTSALNRLEDLRSVDRRLASLERSHEVNREAYLEYALRGEAARVDEDAMRQSASNVRVVDEASASPRSSSGAVSFAAAGVFGGIVLAFVAGLGAAWNRQVFVTPNEAEQAMSMPILATFNRDDETFRAPGSEADIVHLAAQLSDFRSPEDGRHLRSFQFISVDDASIDRRLVRSIARALSKHHHLRVLVLDLNSSFPDSQEAVGLEVDPESPDGIWVMRGAALQPANESSARFAEYQSVIGQLRDVFDIVLVDTPTRGQRQMAQRAAKTVDANILVVRAEESRRPTALRLRDDVLGAGGDICGAVFTGRILHLPDAIYRWT